MSVGSLSESDGIGSSLPQQNAGNSGLFLQTNTNSDGVSTPSWESVGGGSGFSGAGTNISTIGAIATDGIAITTAEANGASAIGLTVNNSTALTTFGSSLLTVQNNGTEVFKVAGDTGGNSALWIGDTASLRGGIFIGNRSATGACHIYFEAQAAFAGVGSNISGLNNELTFASGSTITGWHFKDSNLTERMALTGGSTVPWQLDLSGAVSSIKVSFTDTSGTPGAGTANTASGTAALIMGSATTFKITNSVVSATSIIIVAWNGAPDTTAKIGAVQTTGGFNVVITGTPAAASVFNWWVLN